MADTKTQAEIVPAGGSSITADLSTTDELTIEEMVRRVKLIEAAKAAVMVEDVHYGIIPGTKKPSLLKPGAETLLQLFMLRPIIHINTDVEITDETGGHRSYRVTCHVFNQHGEEVATGVGECSTLENRYRYRWENTGKPVPSEYWDSRDPVLLGGLSFTPRKIGKKWLIHHRVEHDNPADYWNTALKMGKIRALRDGALTATASSGMFSQDDDGAPEASGNGNSDDAGDAGDGKPPVRPPKATAAESDNDQPPPPEGDPKPPATEAATQTAPAAEAEPMPDCSPAPNIIEGQIERVHSKDGGTDTKPWTRYGVKVGGEWHNTFDKTDGETAKKAHASGTVVRIIWEASEYGRDLVAIEALF